MNDHELREFEAFCREVASEMATFKAASDCETRSKAGQVLDKTGQSIGRSVDRLEQALKGPLNGGFLADPKERREARLTDAGKVFLKYCERLASLQRDLCTELTNLQKSSEIRLAITNYAWRVYGSELERVYKERCLDGELHYGNGFYMQDHVWKEIEQEVLEERADVGVYSFPPTLGRNFPDDLSLMDWMVEEFVLVLPVELARRVRLSKITIQALAQRLPMLPSVVHYKRELGFDRTEIIRQYLHNQQVMDRFEGDWLTPVNTIEEIKATLVEKGGISFLPWPAVAREVEQNLLKAYPLAGYMRPRIIRIITRRGSCRPAVNEFIAAARGLGGVRRIPG